VLQYSHPPGQIDDLTFAEPFDIILANINKNILLNEMHHYAGHLKSGGQLLLSGFYEKDIPDLTEKATQFNLHPVLSDTRDDWACLLFQKNEG
jgi:ribosomal protein L11 methyltransferase